MECPNEIKALITVRISQHSRVSVILHLYNGISICFKGCLAANDKEFCQ